MHDMSRAHNKGHRTPIVVTKFQQQPRAPTPPSLLHVLLLFVVFVIVIIGTEVYLYSDASLFDLVEEERLHFREWEARLQKSYTESYLLQHAQDEFDVAIKSIQAGVVLSQSEIVAEAGREVSTQYTVNLATRPTADVQVSIHDDSSCLSISPNRLHFTPQTWYKMQTISIVSAVLSHTDVLVCSHTLAGVVHRCISEDKLYDNLHVRVRFNVDETATNDDEQLLKQLNPTDKSTDESAPEDSRLTGGISRSSQGIADAEGAIHNIEMLERQVLGEIDDSILEFKEGVEEHAEDSTRGAADDTSLEEDTWQYADGSYHQYEDDDDGVLTGATSKGARADHADAHGAAKPPVMGTPKVARRNLRHSRTGVDVFAQRAFKCSKTKHQNGAVRCVLHARHNGLVFYVVDKDGAESTYMQYPVVLVMGGVHGNENAGMGAAEYISKHWKPTRGRLIVIPKANPAGLKSHSRYIPGSKQSEHDLNRDYPLDTSKQPRGALALGIWRLCEIFVPDVLFDLHEGWGFYHMLKNNQHRHLINSNSFSKGSTIISTENAIPVAREMLAEVNSMVHQRSHKFELVTPPIAGGLAARLHAVYGTQAMVLETTKSKQALATRVKEHVAMVKKGLMVLHML